MDQDQANALARMLIDARARLSLSVREVGRRSGVSDTTVMRLEQAKKLKPQPDTLKAIAEALDIDVTDIFTTIGLVEPKALPTFRPYLRTKYGAMPNSAVQELEAYFDALAKRHGLTSSSGPAPGEDEAD